MGATSLDWTAMVGNDLQLNNEVKRSADPETQNENMSLKKQRGDMNSQPKNTPKPTTKPPHLENINR